MPATISGSHLGLDTHANRPAANAAGQPVGALYSCSTHNLIYKTDGSSWATWGTLSAGSGAVATDTIWDAAGDLAVGTGADTAARLAIGAAGLAAVSTGTTVAWGKPYGVLLAIVNNVTGGNKSTTSATQADVDATNSIITFTAPASGNVLVRATAMTNMDANNQNGFFGIRESTTNLVNGTTGTFALQGMAAAGHDELVSWSAYITGVSGGSHTYKLAFGVNGGATLTVRQGASTPVVLEVWSCP